MAILNTSTASNHMLYIEGGTYPIAHPSYPATVHAFYRYLKNYKEALAGLKHVFLKLWAVKLSDLTKYRVVFHFQLLAM